MSDPQTVRFARHVHEVVHLDAQGAPYEALEACVDAMHIGREERSALWALAFSLHHAPTRSHASRQPHRAVRAQLPPTPEGVISDGDRSIRRVVERLARPGAGGSVIERAAILAEGERAGSILAWINAHGWEPEAPAATAFKRDRSGLHGARDRDRTDRRPPLRYVLHD